ncbi:ATPase AAA [Tepiditoga spiralis]|uniref:ATPase AAA n=1 Tax=Tepiditoga spiralis TaxID=2108365 RepID=A0A7G1G5A0_9BACT|nr:ATP-binding protein [Tepiditoga spiralis]BBE30067.1 ATPase AAA [Tepiditoga spiralis]
MKKLPIGIDDFKKIITENYLYIDKTKYIYDLVDLGVPTFLSRPRRFGKSLTLSTLYYLFKGEKELFKDTFIYDKWEFKEYPIIRINLLDAVYDDIDRFKKSLTNIIRENAINYGIDLVEDDYKFAFSELVLKLSKRDKVVVLIDEYERPVLHNINNKRVAEKMRDILQDFYVIVKSKGQFIKFVFMTGITKFTKMGVFSSLNNLRDISISKQYSQMFGYTQQELEIHFNNYIEMTKDVLNLSRVDLLKKIKKYYNGFSFDGEQFVYNPYSVLNFFSEKKFSNYWFESGSPTFLYEYIKGKDITYDELTKVTVSELDFSTREIENARPRIFFIQSGYLTFKGIDKYNKYIIDYPNLEVKNSFSKLLLEANYDIREDILNNSEAIFKNAFFENNIDNVIDEIKRIIASVPYNLHKKEESYYHSLIYTILAASGLNVRAEELSFNGRSDLIVEFDNFLYVIELKKDKSPDFALEQIKEKGYYKPYVDKYDIYLIGININSDKKNIESFKVEKI